MRILFLNVYVKVTGGADRHCLELATVLRARGHSVRFLATDAGGAEAGAFIPLSVSSETRNSLPWRRQLNVARRSIWNPSAAAAMARLIRDYQPDLVHAHKLYPQLSVAPVVCASHAGLPVVQTAHDFEFVSANPEDDRGGRVDRRESELRFGALNTATFPIRRLVHVRRVSSWIAVSDFVASVYARHGIDCQVLENFTLAPRQAPLPFEERSGALFLGRLVQHKGVQDVLELASRVRALDVTVAGSGPMETDVREAAAALPNLHFTGFADAPRARGLLESARVVLMPSRWAEPGSLAALEAMATGTPIVAFASGGLAQYVQRAHAGLLVSNNPAEFAHAAWRLHEDRPLWEEHSREASTAIRTTHSPERYAERTERIYERAVRRTVSQ